MGYEITKTAPTQVPVHVQTAFMSKLTVTSTDPVLYPAKVFVMQEPVDEGDEPWFNCVASLVQVIDYPEDAPNPPVDGVRSPYFRINEISIVSRSATGLQDFIARVEEDVAELEADIDAYQTLT